MPCRSLRRRPGTTFLIPLSPLDADDPGNQLVFAVRTDPPPDPAVQQQGQPNRPPIPTLLMHGDGEQLGDVLHGTRAWARRMRSPNT